MGRINVGRVIIGGLVAGVVANAMDYAINKYLMANEATEMMQRLNLKADQVEGSWPAWVVVDFIYGMVMVFAYAAMRPRFGAGPRTAIIAGMTYWIAITAVFAGLTAMGVYTQQAFMKNSALAIASTLAPVLVGAAIYKED